jgi:hypothetical protein
MSSFDRRPSRVAGERGRQDVVTALERGQNELPDARRVGEAVEAHERGAGAAAMSRVTVEYRLGRILPDPG